ncbi:tail fiber protein [Pseudomonas phage vB_PpuM-Lauda]
MANNLLKFIPKALVGWFKDGEHADGSIQEPPVPTEGVLNRPLYSLYQSTEMLQQAMGAYLTLLQTNGSDNNTLLFANGMYQHQALLNPVTMLLPTDKQIPNQSDATKRTALVVGDAVRVQVTGGTIGTYPVTISGNGVAVGGLPNFVMATPYADYRFIWNGASWDVQLAVGQMGVGGFGNSRVAVAIATALPVNNGEMLWVNNTNSIAAPSVALPQGRVGDLVFVGDYSANSNLYPIKITAAAGQAFEGIVTGSDYIQSINGVRGYQYVNATTGWRVVDDATHAGFVKTAAQRGAGLTYLGQVGQPSANVLTYSIPTAGAFGQAFTSYAAGQRFQLKVATANTGAATLNLNSLGAKAITSNGTDALTGGELSVGKVHDVFYDGASFQLVSSTRVDLTAYAPINSPTFTGDPKAPTPPLTDNDNSVATTAFVKLAIAALIDSSPGALDTLNELAAALGDDPNFATTVNNAIALRATIDSPTFTGDPKAPTAAAGDIDTSVANTAFVRAAMALFGIGTPNAANVTDLNAVGAGGFYYNSSTTATGVPIASNGLMIHTPFGDGSAALQIWASPLNPTRIFWRVRASNSWGGWKEFAALDSPVFTGDPKAPTPVTTDNDTSVATTNFVRNVLARYGIGTSDMDDTVADVGTLTEGGTYQVSSTITINGVNYLSGVVIVATNALYYTQQIFMPQANNRMFQRVSNGQVNSVTQWSQWREIASLDSPTFTGDPKAPTASLADNDLSIANTAFVQGLMGASGLGGSAISGDTLNFNDAPLNSFVKAEGTETNSTTYNRPLLGVAGTTAVAFTLITIGVPGAFRVTQYASSIFPSGRNRTFTRVKHDGAWFPWRELAATDSPVFTGDPQAPTAALGDTDLTIANTAFVQNQLASWGLGTLVSNIVTGNDMNQAVLGGLYRAQSTTANIPISSNFSVIVVPYNGGGCLQIATALNSNNRMFWRSQAGGNWTAWNEAVATDSPSLIGTPTAPTPPTTDNSTRLANTAYAQNLNFSQSRKFKGVGVGVSASITLDVSHSGYWLNLAGSGITVTLPDPTTLLPGATFVFRNPTSTVQTIVAPSGATISDSGSVQQITMQPLETLELATSGTSYWIVDRGSIVAPQDMIGQFTGVQTFTASGSWLCPAGVTTVYLSGCGGGGGGAGGGGASDSGAGGGSGGGCGTYAVLTPITVVPGSTYTITIGGGGAGGNGGPALAQGVVGSEAGAGALGGNGSATTFKLGSTTLLTLGGGTRGAYGGTSSGAGGISLVPGVTDGQDAPGLYLGGAGGAGAGTPWGTGGGGGRQANGPGSNGSASIGYGAGGGGGGGAYTRQNYANVSAAKGGNGSAGKSGVIFLQW